MTRRAAQNLGFSPSKVDGYHPLSEAFCPNFQPRAHVLLTGLTTVKGAVPLLLLEPDFKTHVIIPFFLRAQREPHCLGTPGFVVKTEGGKKRKKRSEGNVERSRAAR